MLDIAKLQHTRISNQMKITRIIFIVKPLIDESWVFTDLELVYVLNYDF